VSTAFVEFIQNGGSPIMMQHAVNKQNFRYRSHNNPQVTVWGPYFFEEYNFTVMVTFDRYCAMLENFLWPKLHDLFDEHGAENVWFQQDGATAHTSRCLVEILREMFRGHVVFLCGDIRWSPDFTPCDFFLWGYLKAQVYQHHPQTLEGLTGAIIQEVATIPPKMTHRVMEKYRQTLNQCINNEGRHLSDVVFISKLHYVYYSRFKKKMYLAPCTLSDSLIRDRCAKG
jgi:hypothetical protein